MNPNARHNARHYALQALYQWQIADAPTEEIEKQFIQTEIKKNTDLDYFKELLHSIPKEQNVLDNTIAPFLKRKLNELDPVELIILRIGTYELMKRPDIPYRVVINESLELTKRFGSIEGFKFVNSILDLVAKQERAVEIQKSSQK